MRSANELADVVSAALQDGREADPELCADHRASMQRAYDTFAALVGRFYHGSFAESFFLRRMPDYEMRRGIMSVLAGDVWRRDNPFQDMLLRSRTARKRVSGTGAPLGSRE